MMLKVESVYSFEDMGELFTTVTFRVLLNKVLDDDGLESKNPLEHTRFSVTYKGEPKHKAANRYLIVSEDVHTTWVESAKKASKQMRTNDMKSTKW